VSKKIDKDKVIGMGLGGFEVITGKVWGVRVYGVSVASVASGWGGLRI
jgi:hypothetical protein